MNSSERIEGFLHRFKTMVDTLMAHPQVRVTHLWIGPPATDSDLRELAQKWGGRIPAAVEALYRQANGMQLRWRDVLCETYDPARDDTVQLNGPNSELHSEPGDYVGQIDIRSIQEICADETVGWQFSLTDDPLCGAAVFETSAESVDAVLYFENAPDDPWVGLAEDYCADIRPPGELRLSTYLEHILEAWAAVDARRTQAPRLLDTLLRQRNMLDPTRVIGERVMFLDSGLRHGRVSTLVDATNTQYIQVGSTFAEVEADHGETLYVPLRALYPPDDADQYETLRAAPEVLRARLQGPAHRLFEDLAAASGLAYRSGYEGGPCVNQGGSCFVGLTSVFEAAEAVRLMLRAANTLRSHPQTNTRRSVAWPATRPRAANGPLTSYASLGSVLFDAAVILVCREAPADLASWLGHEATALLKSMLQRHQESEPRHGYDPLKDLKTPSGFFAAALSGRPTGQPIRGPVTRWGDSLGLSRFRFLDL